MEVVLTLTLLVLQATSCICNPATEIPGEVKKLSSENFAAIAELLNNGHETQDIHPRIQDRDTKHLLEIMAMLQKSHKAPLAIILTRTNLNEVDEDPKLETTEKSEHPNTKNEEDINNKSVDFTAHDIPGTARRLNLPDDIENESIEIKEDDGQYQKEFDVNNLLENKDRKPESDLSDMDKDFTEDLDIIENENISNLTTYASNKAAIDSLQAFDWAATSLNDFKNLEKTIDNNNDDEEEYSNFVLDTNETNSNLLNINEHVGNNDELQLMKNRLKLDHQKFNDSDIYNIRTFTYESDGDHMILDKGAVEPSKEREANSNEDYSNDQIIQSNEDCRENENVFSKFEGDAINTTDYKNEYPLNASNSNGNINIKNTKTEFNRKRSGSGSITYNLSFIFNK